MTWMWKPAHQDHPDPSAFHLRIVAFAIRKHLHFWDEVDDVAMFWDFGSLHQKHRDERQEVLFKAGLKSSNIWHGSTQSTVWTWPQFVLSLVDEHQNCLHLEPVAVVYGDSGICGSYMHWWSACSLCLNCFSVIWGPHYV